MSHAVLLSHHEAWILNGPTCPQWLRRLWERLGGIAGRLWGARWRIPQFHYATWRAGLT